MACASGKVRSLSDKATSQVTGKYPGGFTRAIVASEEFYANEESAWVMTATVLWLLIVVCMLVV
jgi:hypothetical protein